MRTDYRTEAKTLCRTVKRFSPFSIARKRPEGAGTEQIVQQCQDSRQRRGYIGQCGRVQHLGDLRLFVGSDQAGANSSLRARRLASNSTGRFTTWNNTVIEKTAMPT